MPPQPLLLLIAPCALFVLMVRIISSLSEDDTMATFTLAPIGWHPRPHPGLKIITIITPSSPSPPEHQSRPRDDSGPLTTRMDFEDGWPRKPTATKTGGDQDGRLPGWTTKMDDDED
ncbi:hypothetical protein TYRP_021771 [Tyrophagus putrescentiae]|nr:hypothetical protein TYRP_021771 [Tyrophagus putrescentiae]